MIEEDDHLAYTGRVPWHGIGFPLIGDPTPNEMLKTAQLDWTISKRPLFTLQDPDATVKPWKPLLYEDMFAMVRDTDNKVLGMCGPKYTPFQNSEVFEFFNRFTEAGHMKMEVAGSLKGGTWIWALARISDGAMTLMGDDLSYSYLLLCSPHVWGEAMTIMFTSVRVVCWNTLTLAMGSKLAEKFRFIHNQKFADVRPLAELTVESAMIQKAVFEQKAKILAETPIVEINKLYRYIAQIFKPALLVGTDVINAGDLPRTAFEVIQNYHFAPGCKTAAARDTWWGAFNAVTYFFDHQQGRTGPDKRLYDSWVSHKEAVTKRKAFDLALQYAQAA